MLNSSNVESILRLNEVIKRTGRKRSTVYADMKAGIMPKPISIGIRSVGWLESEIDDWISKRIDASRSNKKEGL